MGIPIDATTGNLVGSVPQLLQFDNEQQVKESTIKYAYVWYQTAVDLFSPLRRVNARTRATTPGGARWFARSWRIPRA